jgi:hypothetical protein
MISASPEGEDVLERPREIVSAVSIDGLEEAEDDPNVHGENVKVASANDVEDWTSDRSSAEDEDLGWVGIFSGKAEGSRVFVVNFVDVLVHGTPVEELMSCQTRKREQCFPLGDNGCLRTKEVEHVFVNKKERDLKRDIPPKRERHLPGAHSESLGNWVKQPNLEQDIRARIIRAELHNIPGGAVR